MVKISESALVKKITNIIDKFVLTNTDITELLESKKEYLKQKIVKRSRKKLLLNGIIFIHH